MNAGAHPETDIVVNSPRVSRNRRRRPSSQINIWTAHDENDKIHGKYLYYVMYNILLLCKYRDCPHLSHSYGQRDAGTLLSTYILLLIPISMYMGLSMFESGGEKVCRVETLWSAIYCFSVSNSGYAEETRSPRTSPSSRRPIRPNGRVDGTHDGLCQVVKAMGCMYGPVIAKTGLLELVVGGRPSRRHVSICRDSVVGRKWGAKSPCLTHPRSSALAGAPCQPCHA